MLASIPRLTETEMLTSTFQWRIEMPSSTRLPTHPDSFNFLLLTATTHYSKCHANPIWFTSASPWDHLRGITFKLSFSLQNPDAILLLVMFAVFSKRINIERVLSPNCTKLDTALLSNLSSSPAKCDVDQMNGCQDVQVTYWQTDRQRLLALWVRRVQPLLI